jgi:hypothetical protein
VLSGSLGEATVPPPCHTRSALRHGSNETVKLWV